MSVFRRNMFRGGGYAHRGTGITSGLTPVGMHEGGEPGHLHKKTMSDFMEENRALLEDIYGEREAPVSRLKAAAPALLALSGALLSGKSYQGGLGGGLEIAGEALKEATPYFADAIAERRAEKNAARKEELSMNLTALEMAREDAGAQAAKYKPFEFADSLIRLNVDTGDYDTVMSKPSKLMEVYNTQSGLKEFISENLVRADQEASAKDPNRSAIYLVEGPVTDIEEAYDNTLEKWTFVSQKALADELQKAATDPTYVPRYTPKGPDNTYREVFDIKADRNVFVLESDLITAIQSGSNQYQTKKDGLDTFKEVFSKSLGANVYVTQGDLATDAQLGDQRDFGVPEQAPSYTTYWDPTVKANVLATAEMVTERLKDKEPNNDYMPKEPQYKDTLVTLWNKKDQRNMLTSQDFALNNKELFEPEHKDDPTKAAIDHSFEPGKLVFVTNKAIAANSTRYTPAILGQNITIDQYGNIAITSDLIGGATDASAKQKDTYIMLEDLAIRAKELKTTIEDAPEWAFGISGAIVDFSNKYLVQVGVPFSETASTVRREVSELGQTILRAISMDQRFTNEDRDYILKITGKASMDKMQSYEEVFNQVAQTQILMEERLAEYAGTMGVKPSYEMNRKDLYAAYNNYRIDNGIKAYDAAGNKIELVRRNDLPSFNLSQMKRRLKAYFYDTYLEHYNLDGTPKK